MRIIYFADGPWAHNAFRRILSDGHQIALVVLRYETRDEVLRAMAEGEGVEVTWAKSVNKDDFLSRLGDIGADIGVSLAFNQIFKPRLLGLFPKGVINVHAGKLPEFRGRNILNWALINDVGEIGVTCHYIDPGIDTGDIIRQETFAVSDADDYASVLQRAFELCPKVLAEALSEIAEGVAVARPQPPEGSYCVGRRDGDEFVDWTWGARRVFNHVRAITRPGPGARTWLRSAGGLQEMIIWKVAECRDYPSCIGVPGSVVGFSGGGRPLVRADDQLVELLEFEGVSPGAAKLRVGDRLGIGFDLVNLLAREHASSICQ